MLTVLFLLGLIEDISHIGEHVKFNKLFRQLRGYCPIIYCGHSATQQMSLWVRWPDVGIRTLCTVVGLQIKGGLKYIFLVTSILHL